VTAQIPARSTFYDIEGLKRNVDGVNRTKAWREAGLLWALQKNEIGTLQFLLNFYFPIGKSPHIAGMNINQPFEHQYNALHVAAATGNLEAVKLLLDHGADVNWTQNQGQIIDFIFTASLSHLLIQYAVVLPCCTIAIACPQDPLRPCSHRC
jgi:hypothetical protein